ncbi:hypothetical protein G7Y79_00012g032090 [Physcia stellaris]|nr:hypothetical protein G7Y79_00012g032090 [Physcia stellaris]
MSNKAQSTISSFNPKKLARDTGTWVHDHPYQSAFIGTTCLVVAVPALVAAPALGAAGFGSLGVVGEVTDQESPLVGSAAAAAQGPAVVAGNVFATLTSAGAGGYGVPIVHGVVQGVAASAGGLFAGVKGWRKWKKAPKGAAEAKEQEDTAEVEKIEGETFVSEAPQSREAKL